MKRGKPKMVECVGGPLCGGYLGIRPDEEKADLSDGDYVRRVKSTHEERLDPIWALVIEKLDWKQRGRVTPEGASPGGTK